MRSERTRITLQNPDDFVDFIQRHGLKSPREDGPVVFRFEETLALPYNLRRNDSEGPKSASYSAPVQLFDEIAYVSYDATPDKPTAWNHHYGQSIRAEAGSKRDVVALLKEFNIDREKLKAFDRVKVAQLEELVDTSPADNANIEELLQRVTSTPPDVLVFKVTDGIVDSIQVKIVKESRHSSSLKYILTADFSKHWTDREAGIVNAIEKAKFKVYRGRLGD